MAFSIELCCSNMHLILRVRKHTHCHFLVSIYWSRPCFEQCPSKCAVWWVSQISFLLSSYWKQFLKCSQKKKKKKKCCYFHWHFPGLGILITNDKYIKQINVGYFIYTISYAHCNSRHKLYMQTDFTHSNECSLIQM